jgi:hypothetical protein
MVQLSFSSRAAFLALLVQSYVLAFILLRPLMVVAWGGYWSLYALGFGWLLTIAALAIWHMGRLWWALPQIIMLISVATFLDDQRYCSPEYQWCQFF